MDNLEILKDFILRKQELLKLIKPITLILLLDETKKELIEAKKEYNSFLVSKSLIMPVGEDIYQQNTIDLAKDHYESNIEDVKKMIKIFSDNIQSLNIKLNYNSDHPVKEEKLSYERRVEIEKLFDLISTKNSTFKGKCFEILKNLIIGEIIRLSKSTVLEDKDLYRELIFNFEANSEKWRQSWINQELPSEDFF